MSNTDPTTGDYTFDHLDNEQLMTAINEFRKEAVRLVEQGRSLLEALFIHNTDPEAHIDLRNGFNELVIQINNRLDEHNSSDASHPYLLDQINKLWEAIQKLRDDMIPAINSAIIAHNVDPEAHKEAIHKHNTDVNAHENIMKSIIDFINNHNVDPSAHENLFTFLKKADLYRYSRIGEVMPGNLMGDYAQGMIIPADGRIIDINLYPELKEKIDRGHIATRDEYSAAYPGIWSKYDDNGNYRVPDYSHNGDRAIRFSTNELIHGMSEEDAIKEIEGSIDSVSSFSICFAQGLKGTGAFFAHYGSANTETSNQYGGGCRYFNFKASRVVNTANEVRVKSIYQYPVIYLGYYE